MNKKWILIIGSGVLATGLVVAGASFAKSDVSKVSGGTIRIEKLDKADFPTLTKLTSYQAVQIALDAVPGKVLKTVLENENGFLVYGVEVVTPDKAIMDIKVDAGSGKVLAMNKDDADGEDHNSGKHDSDRDSED
jgi:hypothetical protein